MTSPADELRTAAEKLRELTTAATPGPWRQHDTHLGPYGHTATVLSGERNTTELRAWLPTMSQESWDETRNVWADASYIALMHPGVGAALADWLDSTAATIDAVTRKHEEAASETAHWVAPALAVVRQINASGGAA